MEFGEGLGAVAALQQEGVAASNAGQLRLQRTCLAGKDQRRCGSEFRLNRCERSRIGIVRRLRDGAGTPVLR